MPFNRPTLPELVQRDENDLKTRLGAAGTFLRRAVVKVIARVLAGGAHLMHGHLAFIAEQLFPDTAISRYLRRWLSIFGVEVPAASFAEGNATVTGTNGIPIPEGTILQRSDGIQYESGAEQTVTGGTATIALTALTAGADGNCEAGVSLTFLSPIPGVNSSVTVAVGGIDGGADEEDENAQRARLLDRIRRPPMGGAARDYEKWAKQIAGVTRVWVFERWLGLGTVGVTFTRDNDDDIIPDSSEVEAVQEHIDEERPVTADVTVFAPLTAPVNFEIHLNPDTSAIRAAVTAELEDFIFREGDPKSGILYLSRMEEAISTAEGEFDHALNVPSGNFLHTTGYLPVMGSISWV